MRSTQHICSFFNAITVNKLPQWCKIDLLAINCNNDQISFCLCSHCLNGLVTGTEKRRARPVAKSFIRVYMVLMTYVRETRRL